MRTMFPSLQRVTDEDIALFLGLKKRKAYHPRTKGLHEPLVEERHVGSWGEQSAETNVIRIADLNARGAPVTVAPRPLRHLTQLFHPRSRSTSTEDVCSRVKKNDCLSIFESGPRELL